MTNRELSRLAEQEEGIGTTMCYLSDSDSEKLSAIFQAWTHKYSENIQMLSDRFYSKKNNTQTFRDVLHMLFLDDSREYDNHKWLVNSLME